MTYDEAYQPIIEDGRGGFPEDVRFKAPRGLRQAIAKAAELEEERELVLKVLADEAEPQVTLWMLREKAGRIIPEGWKI